MKRNVVKVRCMICHRPFEKYRKRNNHKGIRGIGFRRSNSKTCSPNCSKEWARLISSKKWREKNAKRN